MTDWTLSRIRAYYATHAELVTRHLLGRQVQAYPPDHGFLAITSADDLLVHVAAGVGGFLVSPAAADRSRLDRMVVTLTTGDGADIATAATAAQGLAEAFDAEGCAAVPAVDGQGGMMLLIPVAPIDAETARAFVDRVLLDYAAVTPELATVDAARADGRMLLSAAATSASAYTWAPYSLVPGASPGVVVPLHADDVAAASAGMPLDIEPDDVADRLVLRGDPAARLTA